MNRSKNPIAIRSKNMLAEALIDLMHEKPFHNISIAELTKRADLSRRTFYRLFSTKEEILLYYIYQSWTQTCPDLYVTPDHSYFYTSYFHMNFWYKNKDFALLLYENDLIIILKKFIDMISKEVYEHQKGTTSLSQNPEALEYALAYSSGGALNVIWKWIGQGMVKSPDEIMELLMLSYSI